MQFDDVGPAPNEPMSEYAERVVKWCLPGLPIWAAITKVVGMYTVSIIGLEQPSGHLLAVLDTNQFLAYSST